MDVSAGSTHCASGGGALGGGGLHERDALLLIHRSEPRIAETRQRRARTRSVGMQDRSVDERRAQIVIDCFPFALDDSANGVWLAGDGGEERLACGSVQAAAKRQRRVGGKRGGPSRRRSVAVGECAEGRRPERADEGDVDPAQDALSGRRSSVAS